MRKVNVLLLGALAATAQAARFSADRYTIDDAWISFRIARNLVQGQGLTYNAGLPPVEGMTNLLWTLLSALSLALAPGLSPDVPMRALGAACCVALVVLAGDAARRLAVPAGADPDLAALGTVALLASSGNLAFHSMSGLETGSYALAWTAAAWLCTGPAPRSAAVAAVACLLALSRPEGVLGGALLIGALALLHRRLDIRAAAALLATVVALTTFRLAFYGDLVPNTFHAKPPDAGSGLAYVGRFLLHGLGLLGPLALLPALGPSRPARVLVALAAVTVAGVAWSGGDWMPGHRRLADVAALLAIVAGAGLSIAWSRRVTRSPSAAWNRSGAGRRATLLLGAALLGLTAWTGAALHAAWTRADHRAYGLQTWAQLGALLQDSPQVRTVASADIGRLGWTWRGRVFDLAGLTDARLARAGGWDAAWFDEVSPEVLIISARGPVPADLSPPLDLRPFEAPMLAHVRERGDYRVLHSVPSAAGGVISLLVRDDVDLPAHLFGPQAATGQAAP